MGEYTPGPWTSGESYLADHGREFEVSTEERRGVWVAKTQSLADARLIAAAPDLLEAVTEYLEWGPMSNSDRYIFEQKFRKAIAKAKGEA